MIFMIIKDVSFMCGWLIQYMYVFMLHGGRSNVSFIRFSFHKKQKLFIVEK